MAKTAYQMRDFSYAEYVKFCEHENLVPVAYEEWTFAFLHDFCKQHKIPNAIWDEHGCALADSLPNFRAGRPVTQFRKH